jgi:hypothetical protein
MRKLKRIFRIRLDLGGNLGLLWGSYLFNHFFRDFIPKKEIFKFLNQFSYFNHQFKLRAYFTTHATNFWIFFKPWDLDLRLGRFRTRVINGLLFEFIWKIKTRRFKTNLTLSLILRFNLRLRGYSIWSASFIAPHIKEDYLGHEHLTVSRQPRKYSEDTFKTKLGRTQRRL